MHALLRRAPEPADRAAALNGARVGAVTTYTSRPYKLVSGKTAHVGNNAPEGFAVKFSV